MRCRRTSCCDELLVSYIQPLLKAATNLGRPRISRYPATMGSNEVAHILGGERVVAGSFGPGPFSPAHCRLCPSAAALASGLRQAPAAFFHSSIQRGGGSRWPWVPVSKDTPCPGHCLLCLEELISETSLARPRKNVLFPRVSLFLNSSIGRHVRVLPL